MSDTAEVFKNMLEVVAWLQRQGFKISKSTAYDHQKQGKIAAEADGTFSLASVEKYAAGLKKADGSNVPKETASLQHRKLDAETRRISAQAELAELKVQFTSGQWITRRDHEQELTTRAQLFKADLMNLARGAAGDIVQTAQGDQGRIADVMEFLIDKFDEILDRYARDAEHVVGARIDG